RLARRRLLHAADLLRLLRLLRHGHRPGTPVRLRLSRELPASLRGRQRAGVLAPLAHLAVLLVPRLPLRPPGRQPRGSGAPVRQPRERLLPLWALARGQLELRGLGAVPRQLPRDREAGGRRLDPPPAEAAAPRLPAARRHGGMGLLPRRHPRPGPPLPGGAGRAGRGTARTLHGRLLPHFGALPGSGRRRHRFDTGAAGAGGLARPRPGESAPLGAGLDAGGGGRRRAGGADVRLAAAGRRPQLQPVHLFPILMAARKTVVALFVAMILAPLAANLAGLDGANPL